MKAEIIPSSIVDAYNHFSKLHNDPNNGAWFQVSMTQHRSGNSLLQDLLYNTIDIPHEEVNQLPTSEPVTGRRSVEYTLPE